MTREAGSLSRRSGRPTRKTVRVKIVSPVLYVTFIACAIIATAIIRDRPYSDKSIDAQVIIKLCGVMWSSGVALYWGITRAPEGWAKRLAPWGLFFGVLTASSFWSPNATPALVATLSMISIFVLSIYSVGVNGEYLSARAIVWVSVLLCGVSLLLMPVFPDFVSMRGWSDGGFGAIDRLRGVTPSANAIGVVAVVGALLSYGYYPQFRRTGLFLPNAMIAVALVTLVLADNRMSMLAGAVGFGVIYLSRGATPLRWVLAALGIVSAILVLTLSSDLVLGQLSRSGETSELTNLTGRTEIWAVALEKIAASPILGNGHMSSLLILSTDPRLFSVAAHTHNLYLEILFSAGIVGLGCFVFALVGTVSRCVRGRNAAGGGLLLFFLLTGITEPFPVNGAPNFSMYAFCMVIAIIAARPLSRKARHAQAVSRRRLLGLPPRQSLVSLR